MTALRWILAGVVVLFATIGFIGAIAASVTRKR